MRLKRETALVLSKVTNAEVASTIEAIFTSQEALDRYFINHELSRKHHRGTDGGIYPKFNIKQYKLYSLEEVKRGKKQDALDKETEIAKPDEQLPSEKERESEEIELLEEERPSTEEGDK